MTTNTAMLGWLGLAVRCFATGFLAGILATAPVAVSVAAGVFVHPLAGVGVAGVAVAGMVLWRGRSPQTFERWITGPARANVVAWVRYRRRWTRLATACNLVICEGTRMRVPRLVDVWVGHTDDLVIVRMLPGHCPADFDNRADMLARFVGAHDCQVGLAGPGLIALTFHYTDTLTAPVVLSHLDAAIRFGKDAA
ncbi:hypothetical protein SAMN05421776_11940 [Nocardia farcinica]|uniref:Uncharacterized protein n=2 Tax=Nocardia farcinica TaxID=37329 RepID=A0A0H5NY38_NOCFR|nr:hypothetical protein [Nocardia farcinica]AXK86641.1 hypothetical protein DXT66_14305 [Nocardia farcinica]PFW99675.1 hypothetical protein CJ468_06357 [Nocardia farcinica]PFX00714.1 hypothetical protein CJ469_04099 [Nocardia farcinica]CRY79954.1 Uncharacterised protein [Nocardia farcinica]SIT33894.1 hypothetical protein SAMN05421776_11940 [Nocardia farcinica]